MSTTPGDRLRTADTARRQAMIEKDEAVLMNLLAEDLTWTHSSGTVESKSQFMAAITEGRVVYEHLEINSDQVREMGDVYVHDGVLAGLASRDGQAKALSTRFLSVWHEENGRLQLVAWQSTNASG